MVSEDPPVIKRTNHCYDFVKALLVLVILYQFEDFLELKISRPFRDQFVFLQEWYDLACRVFDSINLESPCAYVPCLNYLLCSLEHFNLAVCYCQVRRYCRCLRKHHESKGTFCVYEARKIVP